MPLINDFTLRHKAQALLSGKPLLDLGRKSLLGLLGLGLGFSAAREVRDIPYGESAKQRLDLYYPAGREPHSALLFMHGGSWRSGDKDEYGFVGRVLAERGFAVAVVGYRLFPQVRYPSFVHDVAQASLYLRQHHARLGWPDLPLWLCGHSAGAYIATVLGMEPAFFAPFGARPPIAGVISLAGPYSFVPERDASLFPVFGVRHHRQWLASMCPIDCLGKEKPPLLVVHGDNDKVVSYRRAEQMVEAARQAGQQVGFVSLAGQGHFQPLFSLHPAVPGHSALLNDIEAFCLSKNYEYSDHRR